MNQVMPDQPVRIVLLVLLNLVAAAPKLSAESPPARFDPVERDLEGWKLHVEPTLLDGENAEEGAKALTMLANHL
jgi:hypothetical protein